MLTLTEGPIWSLVTWTAVEIARLAQLCAFRKHSRVPRGPLLVWPKLGALLKSVTRSRQRSAMARQYLVNQPVYPAFTHLTSIPRPEDHTILGIDAFTKGQR